jgi:subtilisin family serine protease
MKYWLLIWVLILSIESDYAQAPHSIPLQNKLQASTTSNESFDLLVRGDDQKLATSFNELKIHVKYTSGDWYAVHLSAESLRKLAEKDGVEEIFYDQNKGFLLNDKMIGNANVASLQELGIYDSLLTGKGVILGFIDSGVDYSHPDFINEDGSSRILYIWDQKDPIDSSLLFNDYGYGKLITRDTINQWLDSSYQIIMDPTNWYGHGTTVVGTACSNGMALLPLIENGSMDHDFHGVAPEAEIIMVSSDFDRSNWLASVADGVHFMLAKAEEEGKPIVINLSIGAYGGSHDGLDPVGEMINSWFNDDIAGRMLVCAGGNSRTLRYHLGYNGSLDTSYSIYSSFNAPAELELGRMTFTEFWLDSVSVNFVQNVGLYHSVENQFYPLQLPYKTIAENLDSLVIDSIFDGNMDLMAISRRLIQERGEQYQFQVQVDHMNSDQLKTVIYTSGEVQVDSWSADWLGSSNIVGPESLPFTISSDEAYVSPDSLMQTVSSFSCAENVLTVANYKNRLTYTDVNNNEVVFDGQLGELAQHSSRGPTRDGRIKPEVSASGELIMSSGPFNYLSILLNAAPYKIAEGGWHMRNGGTSMASPIVAGIAALYLQRCPNSRPSDIKNAILNSSYQDIYTGQLPNFSWGYGKVDGLGALHQSLEEIVVQENGLSCEDSLVNLSVINSYSNLIWNTGDTTASICVNDGNYWAWGIDSQGCLQRSSMISIIGTDIIESKMTKLEIFPNPSFGIFNLIGITSIKNCYIINSLGQKQQFTYYEVQGGFRISIDKAKNGLYYFINSETGSSIEFIVSH